jgi:hypothetical protein
MILEVRMRRLFLYALVVAPMTVAVAFAHPARPLYMPAAVPEAPPPRPSVNLKGTTWQGKYLTTNRIFTFEPDGTLSYKSSPLTKNSIKNRGHWHFDGETLYFEHFITAKNKIMEFRGKIQSPNAIVGESITKVGGKSAQTLIRTNP